MRYIPAEWQAPPKVKALTTTRLDGCSEGVFASLNLGDHVDDIPESVAENRQRLLEYLGLTEKPQWLQQVHGTDVVQAISDGICREADACWSDEKGVACIVMTADCLPVFFADKSGLKVAVAHAGWRGLCDGVLEKTLALFEQPDETHIWLGPAIGPSAFEVGEEVLQAFVNQQAGAVQAFTPVPGKEGKYLADIYMLAKLRLQAGGAEKISSCDLCTYTDESNFFSYRRDGQTGRMASLIWVE